MKSAFILVGGMASRANGLPKYEFTYDGKTFLEKQVEELRLCTDEIFIIGRNKDQEALIPHFFGVSFIHDIRQGQGPAGGVHAGAWNSGGDYFFITACDMPFLSCKVISYLFTAAKGYGGAVPFWEDGKYEPLCAVYSRSSVREYYENHQNRRLSLLIKGINARLIPVMDIRNIDPGIDVFVNINDLQSLSCLNEKTD